MRVNPFASGWILLVAFCFSDVIFISYYPTSLFVTDFLKQPVDDHIKALSPKVRAVRNKNRQGLIRSRLNGAAVARGDVLIFLDSHCETTPGWIEPLLARIKEDRSNVVVPTIEVINADTLQYQAAANPDQRGGFGWDLFYKWKPIPAEEQQLRKDETDVIRFDFFFGISKLPGVHRIFIFLGNLKIVAEFLQISEGLHYTPMFFSGGDCPCCPPLCSTMALEST